MSLLILFKKRFYFYIRLVQPCVLLFFLTACCEWPLEDPTCEGYVSPASSLAWKPNRYCFVPPCISSCQANENNQQRLKIADLIDMALLNNPTTQRTWANARAAAFNYKASQSLLYPTVDYQGSFTVQETRLDDDPIMAPAVATTTTNTCTPASLMRQVEDMNQLQQGQVVSSQSSLPGSYQYINNDISVSYLLLDFGGRCATIEAARQALYASDWLHNRQIQRVILAVLQNYYTYSGLLDLRRAREDDLKNAKANLDAAQQLFDAGLRTRLDVLQAQTDLVSIELNIVELEGNIQTTLGRLVTNVGMPANVRLDIEPFPESTPLEEISQTIDELISIAKERRPDLAAAYAAHEQRKEEVIIARSNGAPNLTANLDLQNNIYLHNPSFNNRSYAGTIALNIPIFNGFLYYNQTREAREILRAACADIRDTELQIVLDIITSYSDFKTAVKSLRYSEEFLKFSNEAYEAANVSYREGIGTILDLLSAQRALANARAQRVEARTRWALALANIAFATGTL